jgi:hypothetical protein
MVTVETILGQTRPLETVDRIIRLGKRGQAVLLTGRPGIGKFAMAIHMAYRFLCQDDNRGCGKCFSCRSISKFNHPDFLLVFPFPNISPESKKNTVFHFSDPVISDARYSNDTLDEVNKYLDEKSNDPYRIISFPKKGNIPVEVIKDLIRAIGKKPMLGERRAVVVCDVDQMAFGAADLFLKTVEEPPEDSLVILTSSKPHILLPTLLSRTLKIPLNPVSNDLIKSYLEKQGADGSYDFYIRFSSGSPGLALKAYEEDIVGRRDKLWKITSEFIEKRSLTKTTEALQRRYQRPDYDAVRSDFDIMEKILRDIYISKLGLEKKLINIDIKDRIKNVARMAPSTGVLKRWFEILAKASKVHGVNNVSADIAFIGMFIEFGWVKDL